MTADAGDASVDIDSAAIVDAAPRPDVDQPPDIYPAHHHPLPLLDDRGGPLLTTVKVVTVTFEGDALRDELRQFDDALVTSAWWKTLGNGFGLGLGTSGGYAELKDTVSGKSLDNATDLKSFIQDRVTDHTLPDPDANTLYALYFPTTTSIHLGTQTTCPSLRGFHDSAEVRLGGTPPIQVAYAVLPRCVIGTSQDDKDSLTEAASHEFLEAATDPQPDTGLGWIMGSADAWTGAQGAETADLCGVRSPIDVGTWAVTTAWSNVAAKASHAPCQPSPAGRIYFGAAVDTELGTVHTAAGDHTSDGFATVKRGASRDMDVVVFSEAALPSDVQLTVGRISISNPANLLPMATGITATLSRTHAHNGETSILTLSAASSVAPGDSLFVVRASLATGEYHSWPVILRVM